MEIHATCILKYVIRVSEFHLQTSLEPSDVNAKSVNIFYLQ